MAQILKHASRSPSYAQDLHDLQGLTHSFHIGGPEVDAFSFSPPARSVAAEQTVPLTAAGSVDSLDPSGTDSDGTAATTLDIGDHQPSTARGSSGPADTPAADNTASSPSQPGSTSVAASSVTALDIASPLLAVSSAVDQASTAVMAGSGVGQSGDTGSSPAAIGGGFPDVIEATDAAASPATAYALGIGQTARGTLSTGADHDFYAVTLVAGQTYSFALTGIGTNNVNDTFLRLYAANGTTVLASNDDGLQGGNSILRYTASTSGTYYLDAGSYNNQSAGQYGLSATLGSRASFDHNMGAGVIDTDSAWSAAGVAATVTYGFRQTTNNDSPGFSQVTTTQMAAVQTALQFWQDVAGISFSLVNPGGYTDSATMLFANYYSTTDGAGAYAYYPGSTAANADAGDVWMNTNSVSTTSLAVGGYSFFAIMHEIGHAIGLSHPGLYNAAPGVDITYSGNAQFDQDTQQYSVMSYFDETYTGANYGGYADTPMMHDVLALQNIYGANTTTRNGDTVYGFGSNAGAIYNFAQNTSAGICIWDGGGTDTLDCSGFGQAQTINLNAGTFSSVGVLTSNLSIAVGAVIENAVGGSGNDTIIGNGANNRITGGSGNDAIDGAGGIDTAVYSGMRAAYTVTILGVGSARVIGADGTDTLANFEYLAFSDQTISLAANDPPLVSIANQSLHVTTHGQVAGWLSYSDADSDAAVYYQFIDSGTGAGSNRLWVQGLGYQQAGTTVTVAAADINKLWVGGATTVGSDAMLVRAFDGTDWSAWDAFNVTSTNTAPVATIADSSLATNQWTQIQNWLTYSDADGDSAKSFQFVDLGTAAGSGQIRIGGITHPAGSAPLNVNAADLASVTVGGATMPGSETMWVRAFDGAAWSAWDSFVFTAAGNRAPVATINDNSLAVNQWTQVQNWLSYSDPDGNPATLYQFVDQGTDAGSGQFYTERVGYHTAGTAPLTIAAADLAKVWVGGATAVDTDSMWVRAYDGQAWSAWDPFTFTST